MRNRFLFVQVSAAGALGAGLLAACLIAMTGCGKQDKSGDKPATSSSKADAQQTSAAGRPVLSIHWAGKDRIAQDTNAALQLDLWKMPESVALEAHVLDKLARVPLALLQSRFPDVTNHFSAQLRPLFDDLLRLETFLEFRAATNGPATFALAIRLPDDRTRLWQTNLAAAAEGWLGEKAVDRAASNGSGWHVSGDQPDFTFELAQNSSWTLLGVGSDPGALMADLAGRAGKPVAPGPESGGDWITASGDLAWLLRDVLTNSPWGLPQFHLTVACVTNELHTRGELTFAQPLPFEIEPWNIPTNLIHNPLHSFTAVQGVRPWLASLKMWKDLGLGEPPNQVFFWAQALMPFLTFSAAPLPDAGSVAQRLNGYLMQTLDPWIAERRWGKLQARTNANELVWADLPMMVPFSKSVSEAQGQFLFCGLAVISDTNSPPPAGTLSEVLGRPNLVLYDREFTGPRIEAWFYISQTARVIADLPQLPEASESVKWLTTVGTKLGHARTILAKTGQSQLSFERHSSVGLTAVELQLLADWLASPQFPRGLHSFVAPRSPQSGLRPKTNAPSTLPK